MAREVDPGLAAGLRPTVRFLGATPQGWLRDWDASGVIVPRPWDDLAAHLAPLDALVVSEEDLAAEPAGATPLVAVGSFVALTRGAAGVRLIGRDGVEDVPACPARVHDPTGAGDVFAAAWFARQQRCSIDEALERLRARRPDFEPLDYQLKAARAWLSDRPRS